MTRSTTSRRPVDLARRVPVATDVAVAILESVPEQVLGSSADEPAASPEALADLHAGLPVGTPITRHVRIGFGHLVVDDGALALPVWWEDAEHPHLFPTFDGGLEVRADDGGTEMRLVGSYEPPLGAFGRFADGIAGHRLVLRSLETFLEDVASRLSSTAGERDGSTCTA